MKIKGKTTFELTNVETGEKRVVKEENMVTNAYAGLVQGMGVYGGGANYHIRNTASTGMSNNDRGGDNIRRFSNGLVLFSDKLEEDPNHVFLTADDPDVVGVGADLAYLGNQTCAGSYNTNESGAIENGYKHVWDFTTHQGNGDIGCACLTSIEGASLGFGLPTYVSDWRGWMTYLGCQMQAYLPPFEDYWPDCSMWGKGYFNETNNTFIRVKNYFDIPPADSSGTWVVNNEYDINGNLFSQKVFNKSFIYKKEIELDVFRFPFNNFSIFDKFKRERKNVAGTNYGYHPYRVEKTVTVKMPNDLANLIPDEIVQDSVNRRYYWPTCMNFDEGFMYISFIIPTAYNTVPKLESGGKLYTWKINMDTFESSWFSITNTTGKAIEFNAYSAWYPIPHAIVTNNYTMLYTKPVSDTYRGELFIIDNATSSTIKQVVDSNDKLVDNSRWRAYYVYKDMLYAFYYGNDAGPMYVINLKTGVMKYVYVPGSLYQFNYQSQYWCNGITYGTNFPKIMSHYTAGNEPYIWFYMNPMYLLTINNLEDVVTKTSAETMKVTYIITQEEEE